MPAAWVPRCLLKTWTGVPCLTCGGYRALNALVHGHLLAAIRLQPLLSLLAIAAVVWLIYAFVGVLFGLPRIRVRITRGEKMLLTIGAVVLALANWAYLILDGR